MESQKKFYNDTIMQSGFSTPPRAKSGRKSLFDRPSDHPQEFDRNGSPIALKVAADAYDSPDE